MHTKRDGETEGEERKREYLEDLSVDARKII